jgi:type I restriction enzyme S subunit
MLCDLVYRLNVNVAAVEPRFLVYWLGSRPGRSQVEADARGSSQSMVKVSQGHIRSWLTPVPSLTEQRIIADFLDRKTEAIDRLLDGAAATLGVGDNVVGAVPRMIALLREYRLSIITAAVTGQLDVAGQEAA